MNLSPPNTSPRHARSPCRSLKSCIALTDLSRVVEPHEHDEDALDGDDAAQEVDVGELVARADELVAVVVQDGRRGEDEGVAHRHQVERGSAHVFLRGK